MAEMLSEVFFASMDTTLLRKPFGIYLLVVGVTMLFKKK